MQAGAERASPAQPLPTHVPPTCSIAAVPLRAKLRGGGLGIWKNTFSAQIHFRSPKGSELTHCITFSVMNS